MDFSRFEKYYRYPVVVALLIAVLTYWRFREIDLSGVYAFVAQEDVIHPVLHQSLVMPRSIVWDFFGLLDRILTLGSITVLRLTGFSLTILNCFLLSKLLNDVLGQRFWGFIGVFLIALSPFMVVGAVAGVPAASAAAIAILFMMALYRNEYVFGGILAGIAVAANLPGVIMFLITILDGLQNAAERKKTWWTLANSTAAFLGVVLVLFVYSSISGNARVSPVPLEEKFLSWPLVAVGPIFISNLVVIVGIVYRALTRRLDICRIHFHSLMLWITLGALSIARPTTTNLLAEFVVSGFLAIYFIQGFTAIWDTRLLSAESFLFIFVVVFLFADIYANNKYLEDNVLEDCHSRLKAIDEIVDSIIPAEKNAQLVSNFCVPELSVRLRSPILEIEGEPFPFENFAGGKTIYVVDRVSKDDSLYHGCGFLLRNNYRGGGINHYIRVFQCMGNSK